MRVGRVQAGHTLVTDEPTTHGSTADDRLDSMSAPAPSPIVTEVLRYDDLPLGSPGTRRAVVRWSDGSQSEALSWYADEILVCEG
jgi:hypothetical protein